MGAPWRAGRQRLAGADRLGSSFTMSNLPGSGRPGQVLSQELRMIPLDPADNRTRGPYPEHAITRGAAFYQTPPRLMRVTNGHGPPAAPGVGAQGAHMPRISLPAST